MTKTLINACVGTGKDKTVVYKNALNGKFNDEAVINVVNTEIGKDSWEYIDCFLQNGITDSKHKIIRNKK